MKITYEAWRPGPEAKSVIVEANAICREYQNQGYDLTLRQLYYQFVARGIIPNNQQSYPPPNPTKLTDSRSTSYIDNYGSESWELDALEPSVLDALIQNEIDTLRDDTAYSERSDHERTHRHLLGEASARWMML